jgi:hypothetical protein
MSCRRLRKSLVEYADGNLDGTRAEKVEAHLESCAECRQAVEKLAFSRSALSSLQTFEMPDEASARVFSTLRSAARGDKAEVPSEGRLGFLWSPRTVGVAGIAVAAILGLVIVVVAFTGGKTTRTGLNPTAGNPGTQPLSKASSPVNPEQQKATDLVPKGMASIMPVAKVSQTNYDENTLKGTFDKMDLKKQIASSCTMTSAVSMGNLFRRKLADLMVDQGGDGAMVEAMIVYLTNTEPVLLPYYAEKAMYTGQPVVILGLAGPRRMSNDTKLTRTEVWVMNPEKFAASPDSSIVYFLEEKDQ